MTMQFSVGICAHIVYVVWSIVGRPRPHYILQAGIAVVPEAWKSLLVFAWGREILREISQGDLRRKSVPTHSSDCYANWTLCSQWDLLFVIAKQGWKYQTKNFANSNLCNVSFHLLRLYMKEMSFYFSFFCQVSNFKPSMFWNFPCRGISFAFAKIVKGWPCATSLSCERWLGKNSDNIMMKNNKNEWPIFSGEWRRVLCTPFVFLNFTFFVTDFLVSFRLTRSKYFFTL